MLRAKIKSVDDALNHAKLYLQHGMKATITPTGDGWYLIEKELVQMENVNKLEEVLADRIRTYAADNNAWLTDEQVKQCVKGVRHWFDCTVDESIDTAICEITGK